MTGYFEFTNGCPTTFYNSLMWTKKNSLKPYKKQCQALLQLRTLSVICEILLDIQADEEADKHPSHPWKDSDVALWDGQQHYETCRVVLLFNTSCKKFQCVKF